MAFFLFANDDARSSPASLPDISQSAVGEYGCCVLVVDDDLVIRETVALLLQDEGYIVEQAANGLDALTRLEQTRPKVILLDLRMPVMDGWSFVAELKKRGIELPIVAMTAARDSAAWAAEIGAATSLGKPFEPSELLELVDRLCSHRHPCHSEGRRPKHPSPSS